MNLDMDTAPQAGNDDYNDYLGPVEYQREEMENYGICFEDVKMELGPTIIDIIICVWLNTSSSQ